MEYSEGIELAQEYAERALDIMKSNNIPATPRNFAIWYTYANEKYPDLKKTLDVLISNKQVFTSQKNDEVYDKFFTNSVNLFWHITINFNLIFYIRRQSPCN